MRDREIGRKLICDLVGQAASTGPEPALIVEEYLPGRDDQPLGDYVAVECAVDGGVVALAVTGKLRLLPPFRETGQFWPARLPADEREEIIDLAVAALEALDVRTGLAHVEIKLTPAGPRVIEVNGRLGGLQVDLAQRPGFELGSAGG